MTGVVAASLRLKTLNDSPYILMEKFWYNTPFEQIVRKLRSLGVRMSKSTLDDNVHKAIEYMRVKMKEWWEIYKGLHYRRLCLLQGV